MYVQTVGQAVSSATWPSIPHIFRNHVSSRRMIDVSRAVFLPLTTGRVTSAEARHGLASLASRHAGRRVRSALRAPRPRASRPAPHASGRPAASPLKPDHCVMYPRGRFARFSRRRQHFAQLRRSCCLCSRACSAAASASTSAAASPSASSTGRQVCAEGGWQAGAMPKTPL